MRLPFVSRAAFEIALTRADSEHENAQVLRKTIADIALTADRAEERCATVSEAAERHIATLDMILKTTEARHEREMLASEARYAELMASYRLLRLQGAQIEPPKPTMGEAPAPDPVLAAVNAKAPDIRTRATMLEQVAKDRAGGVPDPEIILRINRGSRPAEDLA